MNNGYFDDLKQEYVIQNMFPRRRLINYLWNEETVCQLDLLAMVLLGLKSVMTENI